jgi:hypothetical protein
MRRLLPALESCAIASILNRDPRAHVVAYGNPNAFGLLIDVNVVGVVPNQNQDFTLAFAPHGSMPPCSDDLAPLRRIASRGSGRTETPSKRSTKGSPAEPTPTYAEWRARCAARLEGQGISAGVMLQRDWRQMYIRGVTPEARAQAGSMLVPEWGPPPGVKCRAPPALTLRGRAVDRTKLARPRTLWLGVSCARGA